jgi:hypothetical protein
MAAGVAASTSLTTSIRPTATRSWPAQSTAPSPANAISSLTASTRAAGLIRHGSSISRISRTIACVFKRVPAHQRVAERRQDVTGSVTQLTRSREELAAASPTASASAAGPELLGYSEEPRNPTEWLPWPRRCMWGSCYPCVLPTPWSPSRRSWSTTRQPFFPTDPVPVASNDTRTYLDFVEVVELRSRCIGAGLPLRLAWGSRPFATQKRCLRDFIWLVAGVGLSVASQRVS